ncbi:universal stress protein UspA, partial [Methanosarcina mazei]
MKGNKNVMVCVTQQKTCERLIMNGHNEVDSEEDNLFVIHVVSEKDKFLNNSSDGEALEYLFGVSKKVGADLTVIRSKDVIKAIADFAEKNNITHIVMGASP